MPEIPNVIGGETITSEWGNDIRNRTLQRYATVAERSAIHTTPVDGDLSFIENTGLVYVYYSGAWRLFYEDHSASHNTAGTDHLGGAISDYVKFGQATEDTVDATVTTTFENGALATFTPPGSWTAYTLMAWGVVTFHTVKTGAGTPTATARVRINPDTGVEIDVNGSDVPNPIPIPLTISAANIRVSITGAVDVSIQYRESVADVQKAASSIMYIATRTS